MIRAEGPDGGEDRILRAKYLDWCSARVAERFLELTPDEIYELAHRASQGGGPEPGRSAGGDSSPDVPELPASPAFFQPATEPESFRRIIEMVTQALSRELELPDFEAWREAYEAAPEAYDEDLLGLWRENV